MRNPETDSDPIIRESVKSVGGHTWKKDGAVSQGRQPPVGKNYLDFLEPSVAQAPCPLQEFLPNSSLDPPPLPLQEFKPLQACFSIFFLSSELSANSPAECDELDAGAALKRAMVPPSKPVKAAASTREFLLIFMLLFLLLCLVSDVIGGSSHRHLLLRSTLLPGYGQRVQILGLGSKAPGYLCLPLRDHFDCPCELSTEGFARDRLARNRAEEQPSDLSGYG